MDVAHPSAVPEPEVEILPLTEINLYRAGLKKVDPNDNPDADVVYIDMNALRRRVDRWRFVVAVERQKLVRDHERHKREQEMKRRQKDAEPPS